VSKEDVALVEKEIELATSFIICSYDLIDQVREALAAVTEKQETTARSEKKSVSYREEENPDSDRQEKISKAMSAPIKTEEKLTRGERVIARSDKLGYFYTGMIKLNIFNSKSSDLELNQIL
jgi:hypothetical protein